MRHSQRKLALTIVFLFAAVSAIPQSEKKSGTEEQVKQVVAQFEQALTDRNLPRIAALVSEDLVVFENGHRNDGWADFRDHHLIPEMKEPAPPSKTEFVKIKASDQMAWAYTKTEMKLTSKTGKQVEARLWSVYVLENRQSGWKIALLDWSFYAPRPQR